MRVRYERPRYTSVLNQSTEERQQQEVGKNKEIKAA